MRVTMLSRTSIKAILLMAAGIASLVTMDATVKLLVTGNIHPIQILAYRSVLISLVLLIFFKIRGQASSLWPHRWRLQIVRALVGFIAPCTFFMSLKFLAQADATVIFFSAPLIITVSSVIFLKERFGLHRWVAVIAGFIGVVVALNPEVGGIFGAEKFNGYLLALTGSVAYAALFLLGRYLSKTESTPSLVMSYNAGVGIIAFALLPWFWAPMDTQQFLVLTLLATLAVIGHFCITAAFASAEASLLSPIEYSALFWAIFYDWLLWQHAPNTQTLLGGSIVIVAGLYFFYRERLVGK